MEALSEDEASTRSFSVPISKIGIVWEDPNGNEMAIVSNEFHKTKIRLPNSSSVSEICKAIAHIQTMISKHNDPFALIAAGDSISLKHWLSLEDPDINMKDKDGATLLYSTINKGHLGIAYWLIGRGADLNEACNNGSTPLHCAASCGYFDMCATLLRNGAQPTLNHSRQSPRNVAKTTEISTLFRDFQPTIAPNFEEKLWSSIKNTEPPNSCRYHAELEFSKGHPDIWKVQKFGKEFISLAIYETERISMLSNFFQNGEIPALSFSYLLPNNRSFSDNQRAFESEERDMWGALVRCGRTEDHVTIVARGEELFPILDMVYLCYRHDDEKDNKIILYDTGRSDYAGFLFGPYVKENFLQMPSNQNMILTCEKLLSLLYASPNEELASLEKFYEESSWNSMVSSILTSASTIISDIRDGNCVVLRSAGHVYYLSDATLSIIIQLMMDPDCRTLQGFCRLLRKEWYGEGIYGVSHHNTGLSGKKKDLKRKEREAQKKAYFPRLLLLVNTISELVTRFSEKFEFNALFLDWMLKSMGGLMPVLNCYSTWLLHHQVYMAAADQMFSEVLRKGEYRNKHYQPYLQPISLLNDFRCLNYFPNLIRNHPVVLKTTWRLSSAITGAQPPVFTNNRSLYILDPVLIPKLIPFSSLSFGEGDLNSLPVNFGSLVNLTSLSLADNSFLTIPGVLSELPHLEMLNLSGNVISDISFMSRLTNLTELHIERNNIQSIVPLMSLHKLKIIGLGENPISFLPKKVNLRGLRELDMKKCNIQIPAYFLKCLNRDVQQLDFKGNALAGLPSEWDHFNNLTSLNLEDNRLTFLPSSLKHCKHMKSLWLSSNRLLEWPAATMEMSQLEVLDLSKNYITERSVPFWVAQLTIKKLSLSGNKLSAVPHGICQIAGLEELNLSDNGISEDPLTIGFMKSLKDLRLQGNPRKKLSLSGNKLSAVPHGICQIAGLEELNLSDNGISEDPLTIGFMKSLKDLRLQGNPVWNPETFGNKSTSDILATMKDISNQQVLLNRTSIVFLGDADSGKSAAIQALLKTPSWRTTKNPTGITDSMHSPWLTVTPCSCTVEDQQFKLFVWDFISERAHEFSEIFLAPRGIIVFVQNAMQSDTRAITKFLSTIRIMQENPFVIVYLTSVPEWERQNKTMIEDYAQSLQTMFANILPTVNVTWNSITTKKTRKEGRRLNFMELLNSLLLKRGALKRTMREVQLGIILSRIAAMKTEQKQPPVISVRELIFYGSTCGITQLDIILNLAESLHQCGQIFYFRSNPLLKDIIILDPCYLVSILNNLVAWQKFPSGIVSQPAFEYKFSQIADTVRDLLLPLLQQLHLAVELPDDRIYISTLVGQAKPACVAEYIPTPTLLHRKIFLDCLPNVLLSILHQDCLHLLSLKATEAKLPLTAEIWSSGFFVSLGDLIILFETTNRAVANSAEISISFHTESGPDMKEWHVYLFGKLLYTVNSRIKIPNVKAMTSCQILGKTFHPAKLFENVIQTNQMTVCVGGELFDLTKVIPDLLIGEFKGPRYSLDSILLGKSLGAGGFAEVRQGTLSGEQIAVKILNDGEDHYKREEIRHEIYMQSELDHPNIVAVLGIILTPYCIITELCPYGDLHSYIHTPNNKMSWALKLRIASDIASGLHFLHAQEPPIVHIDIKSPNILLKNLDPSAPCAKIADFGTCQQMYKPLTLFLVENPTWQAPEMLEGKPYTQKVDNYSAAIVFWELVARNRVFSNLAFISDICDSVVAGQRPEIPPCPPVFRQIIESCWHSDPKMRPEMGEVQQIIQTKLIPFAEEYQVTYNEFHKAVVA
eukprot:TRINITY_DN7267_c0_g1_i2.p1 TRINITY_DN7267_c0_g1~~TRINITY_DN7267_c0_g1_i2.p1  ORF type:complete len:2037 (-),score=281.34 TRINITY_DN7267_c0_g1_i2:43-5445(-)